MGSAKPRRKRKKKTSALFCNARRVCVSVCLCACVVCVFLSVWKRRHWSPCKLKDRQGDEETLLTEDCVFPKATGACYTPSSVVPERRRKGHYNYSSWCLIESAKLCNKSLTALQIRRLKFTWGGAFYTKSIKSTVFVLFQMQLLWFCFSLVQLISFFVGSNIYKTWFESFAFIFIKSAVDAKIQVSFIYQLHK